MNRRVFLSLAVAGTGSVCSLGPALAADSTPSDSPFRLLGTLDVDGAKEAVVGEDGETVFVATTDGFAVVDVGDPSNPTLLAEHRDLLADRETGPLREVYDVAAAGNRLLVVGPAHGSHSLNAALVFDVSNPKNPAIQVVYETDYAIHNAFLNGSFAYLTENDGQTNSVVIVDVTVPTEVSRWSIVDRDAGWRDVPSPLRTVHDVWVGNEVAVLAYWDAGTVLLDVSDPGSPSFLTRIGEREPADLADVDETEANVLPGNHHYARLNPAGDLLAIGREAWSPDPDRAPGGIALWDVSTLTAPARLGEIAPPQTADPSIGGTWTTAHNFDLEDGRLYSSWYQGGVKIHDVSNPEMPVELAWWRQPTVSRFWTAQRADTCVVASNMGISGSIGSIYTFPDRPGTQPDPPSLTGTPTRSVASPTTPEHTAESSVTSNPHVSSHTTPVATPTPDAPSTSTASPGSPTVTDGQPGFGVDAIIAALGIGAVLQYVRS